MPKRILVDAVHPEQTRVVILKDGRVQEFDSETSIKTQLKGNIYLAKVTRVEPSLQAAFVDYGGGRHGFLPFSEINPDYYHVPVADKEELKRALREQQEREMERERELDRREEEEYSDDRNEDSAQSDSSERQSNGSRSRYRRSDNDRDRDSDEESGGNIGVKNLLANFLRKYRIQEVIKRGQILLVQVSKEERGNKGASLTTFITLPGRYCVLMPNTPRQGGVSRRIGSVEDRRRLKSLIEEFKLPDDASIIIRTAGAGKAMIDIRRDYDYLAKIWNKIRELTLSSTAPAFIYGEGNVVQKTLRDLLDDEVDEILIEGDETFELAKEFMHSAMSEHMNKVRQYRNKIPIFTRYRVEEQIEELYGNIAPLESGGYVVINPTEALISIDVNSGKATNQRSVEETALKTNMEAAYEIARQLKLRELSGLIVIDFIDMLELKNRISIEHALRDAFYGDRAKVQIGRISPFGLLEMSRQRLGPSFFETNTIKCVHCEGSGLMKATETTAVTVLRHIENHLSRHPNASIWDAYTDPNTAGYVLNEKRLDLQAIEQRYQTRIFVHADAHAERASFSIERRASEGEQGSDEKFGDDSSSQNADNTRGKNRNKERDGEDENNPDRSDKKGRSRRNRNRRGQSSHANNNHEEENQNAGNGAAGLLKGLWRKIIEP